MSVYESWEDLMLIDLIGKPGAKGLALILHLCGVAGVYGQQGEGMSGMAKRELERREATVQEGQMLLLKGDEAYEAGRYGEAVTAYAGAMQSFPDAPATADLREAARHRYAQATVERARELSRKGDVQGAKDEVDKILTEGVALGDAQVEGYRAELDDPIRTNPSLTKEHAANVDEVRRLLYMAMGSFELGLFDQAKKHYENILKIDPYNKAARRGLERVAVQKTEYSKSAYDEARAAMLMEIDGGWELPREPGLVELDAPVMEEQNNLDGFAPMANKLDRIIIPTFQLQEGTLLDAIDMLKVLAAQHDTIARNDEEKGINFAVNLGKEAGTIGTKTFDLRLTNVPAIQILKYITDITGTTYRVEDYAVTVLPIGAGGDVLISRTYRIPPDFLSNLTAGMMTDEAPADIFNTEIATGGGIISRRISVQEAMARQGVLFPEGASAVLNSSSNTLRVVNTEANQDVIAQIIDNIVQVEPVAVAVRVTLLRIQEDVLKELSFDWMLDTFQFGGDSGIPGASELNLSGGTTGNGFPITDIAPFPGSVSPTNPITAGNRSGGFATPLDSIDNLISESASRSAQETFRAPGIFGVNGIVGNATLQALMRGLDQKKGFDLMAQPSVTTRSGQAASVIIVDEFIYPTEYEPPEIPTNVGGFTNVNIDGGGNVVGVDTDPVNVPVVPSTPTAFETRDLGIMLEVLPVADENKRYVNVSLNPSFSEFDGFVNYGSPIGIVNESVAGPIRTILAENQILMPIFSVQRTKTNLVVADGATIVIGGLLKEEITNVNDKTPILGSIPVLGSMFKSDAKKHVSTAILFFVNVELVDPTGRPYRDR